MTRRALWLAVALAACHGGQSRKAQIEAHVKALAEGGAIHPPVTAVACGDDASETPGSRFDCELTFAGGLVETGHIEITDFDHANLHFDREISVGADLEAAVARMLKKNDAVDYDVDCGADVVEFDAARCTVSDHGKPGGIMRVRHVDGRFASFPADSVGVERTLRRLVEQKVGPVDSVACSPTGEVRPGVLTCEVQMTGGGRTTARYHVTEEEPRSVLRAEFDPPVVGLDELARGIVAAESPGTKTGMTVDCGKGAVIEPPEGVICTYFADGKPGRFRARQVDGMASLERVP